jgi:hypothetical protein
MEGTRQPKRWVYVLVRSNWNGWKERCEDAKDAHKVLEFEKATWSHCNNCNNGPIYLSI